MKFCYIDEVGKYEGQEVLLKGWVYNKRSSGKIQFLLVRDGTGIIQSVMVRGETADALFNLYDVLTQESSLKISGMIRRDKRAPGGYELGITGIEPVHISQDYPITPKDHGSSFLLDHRHLWIRSQRQAAILKIRDEVIWAIRSFFRENRFVMTDTPILTPTSCEGTTTLFETDYFDTKAYLSQSGQLYLEALASALGRVYDFGPTFRAEKSKTRRHLIEFWMMDAEASFMEHEENLVLQENLVAAVVASVLKNRPRELEILERDTTPLEKIKPPFPRMKYREAVKFLQDAKFDIKYGDDIGGDEETVLSKNFDKPVFITNFPLEIKAFYMKPDPEEPGTALCADLLAPEGVGEIIGGSQRIDDLALLETRLKEHNLPRQAFEWYLDLRRFGSVPHSGFGIGLERTIGWIGGIQHIREAIPFPRLINRIYP